MTPPPSMPPMLPMIQPRPVEANWTCKQSGDCCSLPREVVMTKQEAAEIVHAAPKEITLQFRPFDDGMVALKAQPCPLFVFGGCLVYSVRPYNCRRFACMRPDPKTEPFEARGEFGCWNLEVRVKTSRIALRLAKLIQRKAQRWAVQHGWNL